MTGLLFIVFGLIAFPTCNCMPFTGHRLKRHAQQGNSYSTTLQMFTNNILRIERDLSSQENQLRRQVKTLNRLRYELLLKGDMEKFERRIETVEEILNNVRTIAKLPTVTQMGQDLKNISERFKVFERKSKENKKLFADYKSKIYNNHNICRQVHTSWASSASAGIGGLSDLRVACERNEFIQFILFERENPGLTSKVRYKYYCCKYSFMLR